MTANLIQWREQQKKLQKQHTYYDNSKREWITIDGEGWGRDETGRQHYRFIIAANESGFQSKVTPQTRESLTTDEALAWLASLPQQYKNYCKKNHIDWYPPLIGGFALGYDYAHILIDITQDQLENLLNYSDFESPPISITSRYSAKITAGHLQIYNGTELDSKSVDIYDTFKYYQAAFLKVMGAYADPTQWAIIEAGKSRRDADAEHDVATEMVYCLNECRVHSRAMNDLARAVHDMDLHPRGWYGPGSLAASAFRKHRVRDFWRPDSEQPSGLAIAVLHAYIGGRFETTGHGWLSAMYGHDINSAYPHGMVTLPCLAHGEWHLVSGSTAVDAMNDSGGLAVGLVSWHCDNPPGGWGPYPSRNKLSTVPGLQATSASKLPSWPFDGRAWLWSEEYRAGQFLCSSDVSDAWVYESNCTCQPFAWIPDYYALRQSLKAAGNSIGEKVVKLILNSGYGKIAQTIGKPPVPTWIWAGLITQSARAQLLNAISTNPSGCIMVATDAVYSTSPLPLSFGSQLGQWSGPDEYGRTLIIQAGFWRDYDNAISKNRGIAKKYLEGDETHQPIWPIFEELWSEIVRKDRDIHTAVVPVRYSDHIGLARARQYGIERLGQWTDDAYQDIRFRVDKRPHLVGEPINGWWRSAPTRTDRIGELLEVTVGEQYIGEDSSLMDRYFIIEQPDAAEWGYTDD